MHCGKIRNLRGKNNNQQDYLPTFQCIGDLLKAIHAKRTGNDLRLESKTGFVLGP